MNTKPPSAWPLVLLSLPAFVAVWSGWVGLGQMTGFGETELLPGISNVRVNTAVTLPIGAEVLGVIAARTWLSPDVGPRVRKFAYRLLWVAAIYGAIGQAAYHLMAAAGWTTAPWPVTLGVSVLPVGVMVLGLILFHMIHADMRSHRPKVRIPPPPPPVALPSASGELVAPLRAPVVHLGRPAGAPHEDAQRQEIVRWVATVRPSPSDRTVGKWFGRSRNWGAGILREAMNADDSNDPGPDVGASEGGDK